MFLGVDVEGVADASEASDNSDTIDGDLDDNLKFFPSNSSLPMSLKGDSEREISVILLQNVV